MVTQDTIDTHFDNLASALGRVSVIGKRGNYITLPIAYTEAIKQMHECHEYKGKLIFIGNGGSASIASHMAVDYTKNGGIRSIAFNDASTLTCLANDFGYENLFAEAIKMYADRGDIVIAISSSGESKNILNAVKYAKAAKCIVYTLSGFSSDNSLRKSGDLNFYVPTKKAEYGFTEITHLAILHSILDIICGEKK